MSLIASSYVPWAVALAWPLVVLVVVAIIVLTPGGRNLVGNLRKNVEQVSAFGISVELTQEGAEETRKSFEEAFAQLRSNLRREIDASAWATGIHQRFEALVESLIDIIGRDKANRNKLRATIWIKDLLFSQSLYQLLDYYPLQAGHERGRTMSQRFGIVGLTWRLGKDDVRGSVGRSKEDLIRDWAMTGEEASRQGQGRCSFYAIPLKDEGVLRGIVYMDAVEQDVFEEKKDQLLIEVIKQRHRLCQSIELIRSRVVDRAPNLPSFDF